MSLFEWIRPVLAGRRVILEELEQRIVLDASIGPVPECPDTLINAPEVCPCSIPAPVEGLPLDIGVLLQQAVVTEQNEGSFFGRQDLVSDADSFQGRHTDDSPFLEGTADHGRQVNIASPLPGTHAVYMKFFDYTGECQKWGKGGQYTPDDFPGWTSYPSDCNLLSHELASSDTLTVNFNKPSEGGVTVTLTLDATTGCNLSQAELTLHDYYDFNQTWHDGYDISLVNGFNFPVTIAAPYNATTDPFTPGNPIRCLPTIQATSQLGNSQNPGVFGLGNDQCCASCKPPSECCAEWGDKIAGEAHPTYSNVKPNCPTSDPYAPCDNANPKPAHSGTSRCDARPRCQMDGWHTEATGSAFTVTFGGSK
jgi:hypothetical protein